MSKNFYADLAKYVTENPDKVTIAPLQNLISAEKVWHNWHVKIWTDVGTVIWLMTHQYIWWLLLIDREWFNEFSKTIPNDESGWIEVTPETLPKKHWVAVLWHFVNSLWNYRIVRCYYIGTKEQESDTSEWVFEDFHEYDEEKDTYFDPAWWYEFNEYEETNWKISDDITHWMPLPKPPTK